MSHTVFTFKHGFYCITLYSYLDDFYCITLYSHLQCYRKVFFFILLVCIIIFSVLLLSLPYNIVGMVSLQDFILEHYSEDSEKYEESITEFMDLRGVSWWHFKFFLLPHTPIGIKGHCEFTLCFLVFLCICS